MSFYVQPWSPGEIQEVSSPLKALLDITNDVVSISFVNATPYWYRISNKEGNAVSYIAPNSKGNDNFTITLKDTVIVERDTTLPPVTVGESVYQFLIRFNTTYAEGTGLTDYNVSTGGSSQVQSVSLVGALPTGNNIIGRVALSQELPAGDNLIGSVQLAPGSEVTAVIGGTVNAHIDNFPQPPDSQTVYERNPNSVATTQRNVTTDASSYNGESAEASMLLQADPLNTDDILIGIGGSNLNIRLIPGQIFSWPWFQVFYKSASGTQELNIMVLYPNPFA